MAQSFDGGYPALVISVVLIAIAIASFAIWYTSPYYLNTNFEMPNIYPEPTYLGADRGIAQRTISQLLLDGVHDELARLGDLRDGIKALRRQIAVHELLPPQRVCQITAANQELGFIERDITQRLRELQRYLLNDTLPQNVRTTRNRGLRRRRAVLNLRQNAGLVRNGNTTSYTPPHERVPEPQAPSQTWETNGPTQAAVTSCSSNLLKVYGPASPRFEFPQRPVFSGFHLPEELSEYLDTLTTEENSRLLRLFRSTVRDYCRNCFVPDNEDLIQILDQDIVKIIALYIPLAKQLMRELRGLQYPGTVAEMEAQAAPQVAPLPEIDLIDEVTSMGSGPHESLSNASTLVESKENAATNGEDQQGSGDDGWSFEILDHSSNSVEA